MNGPGSTRRGFLRGATGVATVGLAGCVIAQQGTEEGGTVTTGDGGNDYDTVRVPEDQPTVQAGVEAATAGDLVLVGEGTYVEQVYVTTPDLTVRGRDRNAVVLDGEFEHSYGVHVGADGVAVENLTAQHYTGTGVYWNNVRGFRGSYLTAHTNQAYGVYALRSRDGRFEYSYAAGHADAGFYLGRNHPYEAVVANVVAERNALGYSGTSAGGDLTVRDSTWLDNGAGIVPHTLSETGDPQHDCRIANNVVLDNDNDAVPVREHTYPPHGTGILVWGGHANVIEDNYVDGHEHFGIAVQPHVVESAENVIRGNIVRDSGVADLGLGRPVGEDNRFGYNRFETGLPEDVEQSPGSGHERVAEVYDDQERRAEEDDLSGTDWRDGTAPPPQPPMPDPTAPPKPATKSASWGPTGD